MILKDSKKASTGFTLLEVLVALAIVGFGVVTLLQIFSLGLRLGARGSARTETVANGAQVMNELLARKKLVEGSATGTLGDLGRWSTQIQPFRDSSSSLSLSNVWELKEVTLELTEVEGDRERRIEFKTLRLTKKTNP